MLAASKSDSQDTADQTMAQSKLDTIIAREYFERVRSKWFLVATVLGPVFMGFLLFLPSIMAERERRLETGVVRVVDATPDSIGAPIVSTLRGGLMGDTLRAQYRRVRTSAERTAQLNDATQSVLAGQIVGYLEVDTTTLAQGKLRYVGRNTTSIITMQLLERTVNRAVLQRKLEGSGIDADKSEAIAAGQVRVETERLSTRGRGGSGAIGIIFALAIAITLYLTIFVHGSNVMRGVLEEKQTRVAEVVLSSVRSDTLLMGKVIGIGAVGFTQLTAWVLIATGMMYLRAPVLAKFGIQSASFALPELSPTMGIIILLTFLLGFLFYAALFAVVGAIVSTEQDAQQAQMPVVLLLALTLSTVQGILTNPEGVMARVLTVIPFSSPIVLPLRLSLAPIDDTEVMISLATLSVSAIAATFIASRLYRVGILMYGKRPTLREAWRWMHAR